MVAAGIAAATTHGMTFVLGASDGQCKWTDSLIDVFPMLKATAPILPYSDMKDWHNLKEPEDKYNIYLPITHNTFNFSVGGFRQSWKYFSKDFEQKAVHNVFKFAGKYRKHAAVTLLTVRNKFKHISEPVFIGLHMRLGDILKNLANGYAAYGFQIANETFYSNAMKAASNEVKDPSSIIFLAASDSPAIGKEMLSKVGTQYNIVWLEGDINQDFTTLASCNRSIVSGGTFGFWTAWLARGRSYYFANFARPGSKFAESYDVKNFFPPSWIPISW